MIRLALQLSLAYSLALAGSFPACPSNANRARCNVKSGIYLDNGTYVDGVAGTYLPNGTFVVDGKYPVTGTIPTGGINLGYSTYGTFPPAPPSISAFKKRAVSYAFQDFNGQMLLQQQQNDDYFWSSDGLMWTWGGNANTTQYLGCFYQKSWNMQGAGLAQYGWSYKFFTGNYTAQTCTQACVQAGYKLSFLKGNGIESCLCSNNRDMYNANHLAPEWRCQTPCLAQQNQTCGGLTEKEEESYTNVYYYWAANPSYTFPTGSYASSIYRSSVPSFLVGCYYISDIWYPAVGWYKTSNNAAMTPQKCIDYCLTINPGGNGGLPLAAVSNGGNCNCDGSFHQVDSNYGVNLGVCNAVPCSGDSTLGCGSPNHQLVYYTAPLNKEVAVPRPWQLGDQPWTPAKQNLASTVVAGETYYWTGSTWTWDGNDVDTAYLGCYYNSASYPQFSGIDNYWTSTSFSGSYTPKTCQTECLKAGYLISFIGGNGAASCACSNNRDLHAENYLVAETFCNTPCSTAPTSSCGGVVGGVNQYVNVYHYWGNKKLYQNYQLPRGPLFNTNIVVPQNAHLIGCYFNVLTAVSRVKISSATLTPASCVAYCSGQNPGGWGITKVAGVYNGNQCACDVAMRNVDTNFMMDIEACNAVPCSGDNTIGCGGVSSILVYLAGDMTKVFQSSSPSPPPSATPGVAPSPTPSPSPSPNPSPSPSPTPSPTPSPSPSSVQVGVAAQVFPAFGQVLASKTIGSDIYYQSGSLWTWGGNSIDTAYLGCYYDTSSKSQAVGNANWASTKFSGSYTPKSCSQACLNAGYLISFISGSGTDSCACSNYRELYWGNYLVSESFCNTPCSVGGSSNLTCGGVVGAVKQYVSVYHYWGNKKLLRDYQLPTNSLFNSRVVVPTSTAVLGCYYVQNTIDYTSVLNWFVQTSTTMTPASCISYCQGLNPSGWGRLPVAGLTRGNQCVCDASVRDVSTNYLMDMQSCMAIPCSGDNTISCGGANSMLVYFKK